MSDTVTEVAAWCAVVIEAIGVAIISLFALYSLYHALLGLIRREDREVVFQNVRQRLGRGILLGLEFLIAADIIYTVAVELSFESVGALALVVLIRTFLSFTMEVELNRKWPWQNARKDQKDI